MAKTPHSQCRGPGWIPGQGTRSHMPQLKIIHAAMKTKRSCNLQLRPDAAIYRYIDICHIYPCVYIYIHTHTYGTTGTSLAVQWLRFCASTAGGMGLIPGQVRACITCAVRACSAVSNTFVTPWTVAHQAPLSMGFFR